MRDIKKETGLMIFSMVGGLLFAAAEIVFSVIFSSVTVLVDAVFDSVVCLFSLASFILLKTIAKKPSPKFPFGYGQIEPLLTFVRSLSLLGFLLTMIGFNIFSLVGKQTDAVGELTFVGEMVLFGISLFMFVGLLFFSKGMRTQLLKFEILSWRSNLIGTASVGFVFLLVYLTKDFWSQSLLVNVDTIVSLGVSAILLVEPVKLLVESTRSLLLTNDEKHRKTVEGTIFKTVNRSSIDAIKLLCLGRRDLILIYTIGLTLDEMAVYKHQLETKLPNSYIEIVRK